MSQRWESLDQSVEMRCHCYETTPSNRAPILLTGDREGKSIVVAWLRKWKVVISFMDQIRNRLEERRLTQLWAPDWEGLHLNHPFHSLKWFHPGSGLCCFGILWVLYSPHHLARGVLPFGNSLSYIFVTNYVLPE